MAEHRLAKLLAFLILVQLLLLCYEVVSRRAEKEIERVERQLAHLEAERDSSNEVLADSRELQGRLQTIREERDGEITRLHTRIQQLETQRQSSQLIIRGMRKTSELQARLAATFPEMAHSNWGVTTIPFEPGDSLGIEYFVIPAWFTETFIIDHQNAESWRQQKDGLLAVAIGISIHASQLCRAGFGLFRRSLTALDVSEVESDVV